MSFYRDCLGGELILQTIGDSPLADLLPEQIKNCVLHSILINDSLVLLGSDMAPECGLVNGNALSLSLECSSEEEVRSCYFSLCSGGTSDFPLEENFWGALFGGVTDKYGNHWLLNYNGNDRYRTEYL